MLAESGVGWLPYFLARMDLEWKALRDKLDYATKIAPSELFRRQVMATFEEDRSARSSSRCSAPTRACGRRTTRTPTARSRTRCDAIEETLGPLPAADRRKITATNCAQLYGFPHDA